MDSDDEYGGKLALFSCVILALVTMHGLYHLTTLTSNVIIKLQSLDM